MANRTDTELWGLVVQYAREGLEWKKAWTNVRAQGGRDLVKTEDDFQRIYERFGRHPLFAAQWLLGNRRQDLLNAIKDEVFCIDPADDAQVDTLGRQLDELEKGSFQALVDLLDTVAVRKPAVAEQLRNTARQLHPLPFKDYDARTKPTASTQLELPLGDASEQPASAAEMSQGV